MTDDIFHALTQCKRSVAAADYLLKIIRAIDKHATLFDVVFLQGDTWGQRELPIVWLSAHSLHLIWSKRQAGGISPVRLHAELTGLANILSKTQFFEDALIIIRSL